MATEFLLIHGGLWEDVNAERFWHRPGIVLALRQRGLIVSALDRKSRAPSWTAEADHLANMLPAAGLTVVGGSNGCSVAVRLALQHPELVQRLILAWPATAGDPQVDARTRERLCASGADATMIDTLLAGETLRGTSDAELRRLAIDVGVLPSAPHDAFHQRVTVDRLLRLLPRSTELAGYPAAMQPEFNSRVQEFATELEWFVRDGHGVSR